MKNFFGLLALSFGLTLLACSGSDKETNQEQAATEDAANAASENQPANVQEAMQQAQDAMKNMQGGKQVEPINFRQLQELLPEKVAGYERTNKSGETTGAVGMTVSHAEGSYKKGDATAKVDVMDTGGLGMAMMGMAAWTTVAIDKEDENGYERTSTLDGYKCYEKYRKDGSDSELAVIVADRFLVTASQRNGEMEELKSIVKGMDLDKLANMK